MAQPKVFEGTGEELQRHLEQFPKERFQLVPLPSLDKETTPIEGQEGGSLYDLLKDYIGTVEGSGENNAERASELFTEYVTKKHKEGHL